jgi:hypothetical protein
MCRTVVPPWLCTPEGEDRPPADRSLLVPVAEPQRPGDATREAQQAQLGPRTCRSRQADTRSVGRFSIERVLGEFNQPLKRRRIDNSSDATAAPR